MLAKLLLLLLGVSKADKAIEAAGVKVQVKGQSGKMTLTLPTKQGGTMDVEVRMNALRQLDAEGNTLGGGGSDKHSFNSFATQSFAFSEPEEAMYQGLAVAKVTFKSTLVGSSELKIETYIFKEAGSFTVGGDNVTVAEGTIKFNVELGTWSWCGEDATCKAAAGTGDSVELDIIAEVPGGAAPTESSAAGAGKTFDLGGSNLLMLNTYSVDGGSSWMEMPAGYPKLSGSSFTLKFPKWQGTVLYDPIVSSSGSSEADTAVWPGHQLCLLLAAGMALFA